jgi:hypothetical protein
MATPQDADLIIKLYELRREKKMRIARTFFISEFFPQNVQDVQALFTDVKHPEYNAYFRMMTSYWDMAAAMVNHGALDRDLFYDTNGEFFGVWAKIGDFIADLRVMFGPHFLVNLEKLVADHPNGEERVKLMKDRLTRMQAIRAQSKE